MPQQSEITREEQIKYLDGGISRLINQAEKLIDAPMYAEVIEKIKQLKGEARILQAIRKHLTESDLAHWMDRCHELEVKLAEKPEPVRVSIIMEDAKFLALIPFVEDLIPVLKSMNIEVSDGETEEA